MEHFCEPCSINLFIFFRFRRRKSTRIFLNGSVNRPRIQSCQSHTRSVYAPQSIADPRPDRAGSLPRRGSFRSDPVGELTNITITKKGNMKLRSLPHVNHIWEMMGRIILAKPHRSGREGFKWFQFNPCSKKCGSTMAETPLCSEKVCGPVPINFLLTIYWLPPISNSVNSNFGAFQPVWCRNSSCTCPNEWESVGL